MKLQVNECNLRLQSGLRLKHSSVKASAKPLQQNGCALSRPLNKSVISSADNHIQIVISQYSSINPSLLNECSGRSSALFRGACQNAMTSHSRRRDTSEKATHSKKENLANNWIQSCVHAIAKELKGIAWGLDKQPFPIKKPKRCPLVPIAVDNMRPLLSSVKLREGRKTPLVPKEITHDVVLKEPAKRKINLHRGVSESTKSIKQDDWNNSKIAGKSDAQKASRTFYMLKNSILRSVNKDKMQSINKEKNIKSQMKIQNVAPIINEKEVKYRETLVNKVEAFGDYANGIILNRIYN
eukprot:TRINITY_DN16571_c0_g1_i3.p1 TRINITY_DN16571_c0_g1~~TRINITY_DN16571_c0_g1_i3.p1  ORF type:complete len:297 (+),score=37.35 TRINITY_DN16571_c0_g1_i3:70-960(+)